jgi:S-DNA-T family DNA segregation ATPase FtsK/SpoIIIE
MRLKFTLARGGGRSVDLVATVEGTTTIGDLAEHLARTDPSAKPVASSEPRTLGLVAGRQRVLDPRMAVVDSDLVSGATVAVLPAGADYVDSRDVAAAVVTVVDGPDLGREFVLARGSSVIGRERGCAVLLTDSLVSRRHARINIGDVVEVIDLGSANGVTLGESVVDRSVLGPGDTIGVGDTRLLIKVNPAAMSPSPGPAIPAGRAFVRSPLLRPRYDGVELVAPEPPQRRLAQRFPVISLVAPLLMGGLLYLVTRSITSLLFVGLSPLMLVGTALESRWSGRISHRQAVAEFRADLAGLCAEATVAGTRETEARQSEHPSVADCVVAVRAADPLLWCRRPDDPGFLELRLGVGAQQARNQVSLPERRRAPRELFAELVAATEPFGTVDPVPVVARPAEFGALGLAGPRPTMLAAARGLVIQLAALHSPAEVVLAGCASSASAPDWDWLKWFPHTSSGHSPLAERHLAATPSGALALVSELEDLITARAEDTAATLPAIVLLVEDDAPVERSRLVGLAERGPRHGVHVLWLAADVTRLPAACRTFLRLTHRGDVGTVGFAHDGTHVDPVTVDLLDLPVAEELAHRLAPIVDSGARIEDDSDLPRSVSLLSLMGPELAASGHAVIERWTQNRSIVTGPYAQAKPDGRPGTLRAIVGQSAGRTHAVDLRADGPHALVGGTTGAGKSELLQAWILAMAAAHSPERLTFLLVDYKGGSAFSECARLPHTVGLVTDLSPHLVRRALTSLLAELRHREEVLARHQKKDLLELEKAGLPDAPPSLVIVVDEFAALATEVPEFVDGVVNIAQRGRSLGLHLILATQRPAGVIKDNLRANTNLRLALRMADENDSTDVLGSPQAAFFDPALPGRAVAKTGPGRLVPFQTGYAGGWTTDQPPPPDLLVEELSFGAGAVWALPRLTDTVTVDPGPTDITRLVGAIRAARELAGLPLPRKPWLPELAEVYDLSRATQVATRRRDDCLVFGVRDDPARQSQPPVAFEPDRDGNLAVYGTGGSGKSTLLRTIAVAAGYTVRGGPCHVYGLDFGAQGLAMLTDLPHVGSVVPGADQERVARLLTMLRATIDERANRYAAANAGTITEYRAGTGRRHEPRILLLLDGVAAFRSVYEVGEHSRLFETLIGIASDGRPVGVHVVLSADRPNAVPSALASAIQRRVVLRLADAADYGLLGLPLDVLTATSPPGRGLLGPTEIQVAILGDRPDVGSQSVNVRLFGASMRRADAVAAPPISRLGDLVPMVDLPTVVDDRPVLGISSVTLGPQPFEPSGGFLICGPPGAGRTTALLAVATAVHRWRPDLRLHYLGGRRAPLAGADLWTTTALGAQAVADAAKRLADEILLADGAVPMAAVFVDSLPELAEPPADNPLTELASVCVANDVFVVMEGEASALAKSPLTKPTGPVRNSRTGLALRPDAGDGLNLFRTQFPNRLNQNDFPAGRALLVSGGRTSVVHIGLPGGADVIGASDRPWSPHRIAGAQ